MPDKPEFERDDPDVDGQDRAEMWDQDNQDTDERRLATDDEDLDADDLPDVFDATRRVGDEDDDDAVIGDDLDDEAIVELSIEDEDEGYNDEDPDAEPDEDDEADDNGVARSGPEDVELVDAGDLTRTSGAVASARRLEAARLSDEELQRLGYGAKQRSVATPNAEAARTRREEALDDSVEATFPASDPVAPGRFT